MLKVAFWSFFRERGGVTSNMLAVAMVISRYFHKQVGIRSNHISNRMMDYYISEIDHRADFVADDRESFSRDTPEYLHYLLDYDEKCDIKPYEKRILFRKNGLGISMYRPPEIFEKDLFWCDDDEIIMLDLSGKNNTDSMQALDTADVDVIMLPPSVEDIKLYFSMFPVRKKKTYYVINGISEYSELSPKEFRDWIMSEFGARGGSVLFIPYYDKLRRATHIGEVDLLMEEEMIPKKMSLYFRSVKEIGKKLLLYGQRTEKITPMGEYYPIEVEKIE